MLTGHTQGMMMMVMRHESFLSQEQATRSPWVWNGVLELWRCRRAAPCSQQS